MEDIKFTLIKIVMDLCNDILYSNKPCTMYQYEMAEKIDDALDGVKIEDIQITSLIMATNILMDRKAVA